MTATPDGPDQTPRSALDALRHVLDVYADADDGRVVITATSSANASTGEKTWTGLTLGDLRNLVADVRQQAADDVTSQALAAIRSARNVLDSAAYDLRALRGDDQPPTRDNARALLSSLGLPTSGQREGGAWIRSIKAIRTRWPLSLTDATGLYESLADGEVTP